MAAILGSYGDQKRGYYKLERHLNDQGGLKYIVYKRLLEIWVSFDFHQHQWSKTNSGFYTNYNNSQTPVIIIVSALIRSDYPAAGVGRFVFTEATHKP